MKAPVPMHIPDGFLSLAVALVLWLVSIAFIGLALRRAGKDLPEERLPLVGVLAAAIFAGQMLNFSVAGGTSGHLLGSALAVMLLGPWTAVLVMVCVVSVQALIFQDGGVIALGANLFNMAIVGVAVAYFAASLCRRLFGKQKWMPFVSAFAAGWLSIFIASLAAALELAVSGTSPAAIAVPAMAGIHALIGIGEGLITFGAVSLIMASFPQLLDSEAHKKSQTALVGTAGLIFTLALLVLSPLASSKPDGLEWVAEKLGFLQLAQGPFYTVIPDYVMPGVHNEAAATILAGVIGCAIVIALAWLIVKRKQAAASKS